MLEKSFHSTPRFRSRTNIFMLLLSHWKNRFQKWGFGDCQINQSPNYIQSRQFRQPKDPTYACSRHCSSNQPVNPIYARLQHFSYFQSKNQFKLLPCLRHGSSLQSVSHSAQLNSTYAWSRRCSSHLSVNQSIQLTYALDTAVTFSQTIHSNCYLAWDTVVPFSQANLLSLRTLNLPWVNQSSLTLARDIVVPFDRSIHQSIQFTLAWDTVVPFSQSVSPVQPNLRLIGTP